MNRHPANSNLTLHYETTYLGMPLCLSVAPFVQEYLLRLHQTLTSALRQYPRVFAFRFDLRMPSGCHPQDGSYANRIIDRFIESFKAKIRHNRQTAFQANKYAHDSIVRHVWTRECGQLGRPHYHLAIFLNRDAFCALGSFIPGRENMFNRLNEAWASALGLPLHAVTGLVHIPTGARYHLHRDDHEGNAQFFKRTSYMCKSATKFFGDGGHGFGASRT